MRELVTLILLLIRALLFTCIIYSAYKLVVSDFVKTAYTNPEILFKYIYSLVFSIGIGYLTFCLDLHKAMLIFGVILILTSILCGVLVPCIYYYHNKDKINSINAIYFIVQLYTLILGVMFIFQYH